MKHYFERIRLGWVRKGTKIDEIFQELFNIVNALSFILGWLQLLWEVQYQVSSRNHEKSWVTYWISIPEMFMMHRIGSKKYTLGF